MTMSDRQMTETDHDDGLVHSHGWACTERGAALHEDARRKQIIENAEIGHDDGLVHDHGWARTERLSAHAAA